MIRKSLKIKEKHLKTLIITSKSPKRARKGRTRRWKEKEKEKKGGGGVLIFDNITLFFFYSGFDDIFLPLKSWFPNCKGHIFMFNHVSVKGKRGGEEGEKEIWVCYVRGQTIEDMHRICDTM